MSAYADDTRSRPDREELADELRASEWSLLRQCCNDLILLTANELRAAAVEGPGLLLMWVLKIPLLFLAWVSLSMLVSWAAFSFSGIPLVGFAVLFMMQLCVLAWIERTCRRKLHSMSLPQARRYASRLVSLFVADSDGNRPDVTH